MVGRDGRLRNPIHTSAKSQAGQSSGKEACVKKNYGEVRGQMQLEERQVGMVQIPDHSADGDMSCAEEMV